MSKYSGIFAITSAMQNSAAGKWYGRPCAPTVGSVTVTANTASVPVTASANTNGSTTVSYTATSNTGISNTSSSSPVSVPGLTKNTAYTFTVVTNSNLGSSASSSASNSILAQGVPNAPTIGTATATGTSASITFTAPTCNGGNTITSYTAVANTGGFSGANTTSPVTVSGLTGGASYTFIVYATNALGNSANSSPSNSVFAATTPGIPTSVSASATSSSSISVSFTAPACNGGASIDYYQAVCTATGTNSATGSSPISVTGLSAGTSYTFKVRAHNSQGYGSYSSSTGTATTNTPRSSISFTSAGSTTWIVPSGVTTASAVIVGSGGNGRDSYVACCGCRPVCVSPGAGSGGGLSFKNNFSVTPGTSYNVTIRCDANFIGIGCGGCATRGLFYAAPGYGRNGCSNYNGGCGTYGRVSVQGSGGGGAGGYSGRGGNASTGGAGCNGAGGGGGGASLGGTYRGGPGGGGVGIYGQGSNGSGGSGTQSPGGGGSGGSSGSVSSTGVGANGGAYGGGGGSGAGGTSVGGYGQVGAIRIVWPGNTRTFPTTCVGSP